MIDYVAKFNLEGKKAVVTGGTGLIGEEIVVALAQAGAHVVIADVKKSKTKTLTDELIEDNLRVEYCYFDITDIKNLEKNIKAIAKYLGHFDIWVNCAYPKTKDWGKNVVQEEVKKFIHDIETQKCSGIFLTSPYFFIDFLSSKS